MEIGYHAGISEDNEIYIYIYISVSPILGIFTANIKPVDDVKVVFCFGLC